LFFLLKIGEVLTSIMASGTLYTYPKNWRAYKVLIAAEYSGASVTVDSGFEFGKTNKTEEFLKKFPLGKVPAFETKDGVCLFDSNAIAHAVANEALQGASPVNKAQVSQWISFADTELLPAVTKLCFPLMSLMYKDPKVEADASKQLEQCLSIMNSHLLHFTYFVGERITLADITLCCTLLRLYECYFESAKRATYKNVHRWFNTVINQPQFKKVLGEVKMCEAVAEFDADKFKAFRQQAGASTDAPSNKKQEKKAKSAAPAKPKQEKPKQEKKEESPAPAPAPKPKDPLDALPAGSFNMDDFKRFYSNNDEDKSVPYFWEKFDKENYSIWMGEYKYDDELSKIFMTCNLVGGMFQRLEKLRKNAFASVCIFGKDNENSISGIWVWRGHDLAFKLSDDWGIDYDSYDWAKLDPDTDETKKLVDQYFKWVGEDKNGKAFNQGKIFK